MTRCSVHECETEPVFFDSHDYHVNGWGGLVVNAGRVEQRQAQLRAGAYGRRDVKMYEYAAFGYVAGDVALAAGTGLSTAGRAASE